MADEQAIARATGSNAHSKISALQISKWILVFAAAYDYEVTDELTGVWTVAFTDINSEQFDRACNHLLKTWVPEYGRKFPAPADVLRIVQGAQSQRVEGEAENVWGKLLNAVNRHYHPDIGWKGPRLTERTQHAARAAGGIHFLSQCTEEELQWAKKRFVECYLRDEELPTNEKFLSDAKAREILQPIAERMSLAPKVEVPTHHAEPVKVMSHPHRELSEEEYQARKKILDQQVAKMRGTA